MSLFSRFILAVLPYVPKPIVGLAAKRYVAGETVLDAVKAIKELNKQGAMATVDVLGEEVQRRERAEGFTQQYLDLFDTIREHELDANVSVKPTMLGLKIDEDFCRDNIDRICAEAKSHGSFLRIDMEDRTTTDATLRIYRTMYEKHGCAGTVLQSYMRRNLDDIAALPADANIRLCKGIYIEPEEIAFRGYEEVRANFLASLEALFAKGIYVGIATHDEYLVNESIKLIEKYGLERGQYEFQMLYGVLPRLRQRIIGQGHRMRVYVPFGVDWHPYSMRRLRENPGVAIHIVKAFFGLR